jgi:hypothetical protein
MNLQLSIDPSEFAAVTHRIVNDAKTVAWQAVERATKAAVVKAKEGRFKDRTGNLRAHIFPTIEGWSGSTFWARVTSPDKYAKFVEYPTAPHEIVPKGPGYPLHWVGGKYGPGDHYAYKVQHPGTSAVKYMQAASYAALTTLRIAVREGFYALSTIH